MYTKHLNIQSIDIISRRSAAVDFQQWYSVQIIALGLRLILAYTILDKSGRANITGGSLDLSQKLKIVFV